MVKLNGFKIALQIPLPVDAMTQTRNHFTLGIFDMVRSHCFPCARFVFLVAAAVLTSSVVAVAQQKTDIKVTGVIHGMQGNTLLVEGSGGEKLQVAVQPKQLFDVIYTGTAEASWLSAGVPVRFTGSFNRKGIAQQPIVDLIVYNGGDYGTQVAKSGGGLFETVESPEPKKDASDPNAVETLQVQGVIKSVRDGKYQISAGKAALTIEVPADAKISIELNNPRLAQKGDPIELQGWTATPANQQIKQVIANKVTIASKIPLVGKTKPVPKSAEKAAKNDATKKPDEAANPFFK